MPLPSLPRRLKLASLGAALLLSAAAAQAQQIYINTPVQLYAGPDANYPIVTVLYPGIGVEVIGCLPGYAWCDIVLPDGLRGWVFGMSLTYDWMGDALPVQQYGPTIGIPLVTFIIGDYWGRHYRHQPWYGDRHEYRDWRPAPPPRVMPAPAPMPWGGWNGPPPRYDRDRPNPPHQEHFDPPRPPRDTSPPPNREREPGRGGNVVPTPAPAPSGGWNPSPQPERERPNLQRQERFNTPRPQEPSPPLRPNMMPAPNPAMQQHQEPRFEAPRPQREITLPPRQDREPGRGPNRQEGPHGERP